MAGNLDNLRDNSLIKFTVKSVPSMPVFESR